mgnify:CR=1 FL=1
MAILRTKDIKNMKEKEIEEKLKELKMELIKNKVDLAKGGKSKIRTIKKTIAKLHTFNRLNNRSVKK